MIEVGGGVPELNVDFPVNAVSTYLEEFPQEYWAGVCFFIMSWLVILFVYLF